MRRAFKKGTPCNTDATRGMERLINTSGKSITSSSAPINISQARKLVRESSTKRKAGTTNTSSTTSTLEDRTPSNDVFLRNKSSNHRGYRNNLHNFTPEKEKEKEATIYDRTRRRAARKSFSPTASPGTVAIADIVQERLAGKDNVLFSLLEDVNPKCSQEALGYCMKKVERSLKRDG